jgi:predicted peptidase
MIATMFAGTESFVLAPQTSSQHDVRTTLAILDDVRSRYRIDPTRLYGVGQSLGGFGLLDLVQARPTLFASAVVIAASGDAARAPDLATVPVWFFHGEKDEVVPVEGVRRLVAAARKAGATVRYTEYAGEEHGLAWLVVKDRELVPWVFAQQRKPTAPPADPGAR